MDARAALRVAAGSARHCRPSSAPIAAFASSSAAIATTSDRASYATQPPRRTTPVRAAESGVRFGADKSPPAHYAPPPVPPIAPGKTPVRQGQRLMRMLSSYFLERAKPENAVEIPMGLLLAYYDAAAGQANAEFEFFHHELGMPENFRTWFTVTTLHAWMINCRLRALLPPYGRAYQGHLVSVFFNDVESRMKNSYGVKKASRVDQYAREALHRYHGSVMAYDEGLLRGDATLASALWRNLLEGRDLLGAEEAGPASELPMEARQIVALERLVGFVHRELHRMGEVADSNVLGTGNTHGHPTSALLQRFGPIVPQSR